MMRFWMLALALSVTPLHAAEPVLQPFVSGSAQAIRDSHQAQPFLLVFWSADCVHCRGELKMLGDLARTQPNLPVVMVATDLQDAQQAVADVLREYTLEKGERWIFADEFVERLRYQVDPRWHGELPRNYLYAADGHAEAVTGPLEPARLARWLKQQSHGHH